MSRNKLIEKIRDLVILKNKFKLSSTYSLEKKEGILMLHQDDMPSYNSWFLIEHNGIDEIVYRGKSENISMDLPNIKEGLSELGNPEKIIVTFSTKDTY